MFWPEGALDLHCGSRTLQRCLQRGRLCGVPSVLQVLGAYFLEVPGEEGPLWCVRLTVILQARSHLSLQPQLLGSHG